MPLATELTLPRLAIHDGEFQRDPAPYLDAARSQHPWLAKLDDMFVVHGHQAIADLSLMDDKLVPAFDGVVKFYGAEGTGWARYMHENILAISGPTHKRIRDSVANAFTPRTVNRFRAQMRARMHDLLDEWAPKGQFDFAEFAAEFPISMLCAVLGTSTKGIPDIKSALETQSLVLSLKRELLPGMLAGYDVQWKYIDDLLTEREKNPPEEEGFLDTLIAVKKSGQIDDIELRHLLLVLFPAGYDTSKNMITLIMHMMLSHPAYWERCAVDMDFCAKVVEEMFRHTSTAAVLRKVAEEFEYGGVRFPVGAMLFYANSVAGRDPRAFENPETFDPERDHNTRHVAFGRGAHMCVGQHLARAQITEGIHLIAQRITKPKLVGEVVWRKGVRKLPIAFVPAPAH